MNYLIGEYVKKLTEEDIYNFALKEGTKLLDYEAKIIYKYIKNYWEVLISKDSTFIFEELKKQVRPEVYEKLVSLYDKYKN